MSLQYPTSLADLRAGAPMRKDLFKPLSPNHQGPSWMNLVEVWVSTIERQAIHRGTFGSVKELNAKIRQFIDG